MYENHHLHFIKQTMLKHEDTFRHQVRELHRLYNVQKNLMDDLRNDTRQNNIEFSPRATLDTNNDKIISGLDILRPDKLEEDMLRGDDSGTAEDQIEPHDVELTLSIGPSTSKRRTQNCYHHQMGGNDPSKVVIKPNLANSSTLLYNNNNQDSKRPHWLFQDLSLNRT
uniref:uncharacterized protein LOC122598693 n=1 Tax=Erigeron canadensis TaxID=72917 RepID=UPI001CB94A8A|nr:uncharacterized protein LOC122598693 [Erigeron canadensis]